MVSYSTWGGNKGIMGIEEYAEVMQVLEVAQNHEGGKGVWHQSLENKN